MKKVTQDIYDRIDNDLYHADGDQWWQSESPLYLIQSSVNPVRVSYFRRKMITELKVNPKEKSALEVGCGGGILCEEIARMGFDVTGIDPSLPSLQVAINHAKTSGLQIKYEEGTGEALPYQDSSFDVVFCCDVLEHVRDVPKVIKEISRVLKPGGLFFYDTINRTYMSKLIAIYIAQVWKRWAFAPPNIHVWKMFIKPDELRALLEQNNLEWKEHIGMGFNVSSLKLLNNLRKRAKGEITYEELGRKIFMIESSNMNIMYMGFTIKNQQSRKQQ